MKHIYYKNDFAVEITLLNASGEVVAPPDWQWHIEFTDGRRKYICSVDKGNANVVGNTIMCYLDNHKFCCGEVGYKFVQAIPDLNYLDGFQNLITPKALPIELWEQESDNDVNIQSSVVPAYVVYDAYQTAKANGYTGTAEEFYDALIHIVDINTAEAERVEAEANRVTAEQQRVENFVAMESALTTATSKANTATTKAEEASKRADNSATAASQAMVQAKLAANGANAAAAQATQAMEKANTATENAKTATANANNSAVNAGNAATEANEAAKNANDATEKAKTATTAAEQSAERANTAAENADVATSNATTATTQATTATNRANDISADLEAKREADYWRGAKGEKGDDGVSPTVSTSKTGNVTTIEITDAQGTHTATVNDGESVEVVQSKGTSTTAVMSQKAVSDKLSEMDGKVNGVVEGEKSFEDAIRDQVNNYKPIVIEGNVTNAADEEDITSENGLLKLKDRSALNGMGYVILRKGKTFAEQVIKANTVYEIRYDFDLNGAEITLPENCALKFNGGKLENGTLVGDNTKVNCDLYFTIFNKIIIRGNFLIEKLTPQNFGAVADGIFDCSDIFKQLEELPYNVFIPRGLYKVNNLKIKNSKEWHFEASGSAHWFDENCAKILTSTGVAINGGPIIYNLLVKYNGNEVDISKRGTGISLTSHWAEIHRAFVSNFNVGILLGGTDHCDYTRLYNVNSWYNYYAGIKIDYSDRAQVNFISIFDCNSGSNGVDVHNKEVEPNITRGFGIYLNGGNSIYINNADVSSNECAGIYIDTPTTLQAVRGLKVSTIYAEHNKYCNIYFNKGEGRSTFIDITNTYFYNDETDKYFKRDVIYSGDSNKIPGIKFSNALPVQNYFNYGSLLREDTDYISKIPVSYVRPNTTYEIKIRIKAKEIGDLVLQNEYRGIKYTNSAFLTTSRISVGPAQTLTVSSTDISEYTFYIKTPPSDSAYIVYNTSDYGVKYELIDIALKELPYRSGSGADRPGTAKIGFMYFDTTLKRPIWKVDDTLNSWVDATGQRVY